MGEKYLLPCRCGRKIVIEPRQAGETVSCSCGETKQAPRMLDILALEPAPSEAVAPKSGLGWGWRQKTKLLGAIILAATVVAGALLLLNRPVSPFQTMSPEEIQRNANQLTPSQSWDHWQFAKLGLDRRTDQKYEAAVVRFRIWMAAAAVAALLGLGLVAAGMAPARRGEQP